MTTKRVKTFTANIYVGLRERYSGVGIEREVAVKAIQDYVNLVGLCVSVTDTHFVYTNGGEPGLIVGLINYPRFPSSADLITAHALAIGEILLKTCKQMKVSIVMPAETIMISTEEQPA